MLKTNFESQEKKPLYESPSIKEINIVTSQRILETSPGNDTENGEVTYPTTW